MVYCYSSAHRLTHVWTQGRTYTFLEWLYFSFWLLRGWDWEVRHCSWRHWREEIRPSILPKFSRSIFSWLFRLRSLHRKVRWSFFHSSPCTPDRARAGSLVSSVVPSPGCISESPEELPKLYLRPVKSDPLGVGHNTAAWVAPDCSQGWELLSVWASF